MKAFNKKYLQKELLSIFKEYELTSEPTQESLFFVKKIEPKEFRDTDKGLIKTGSSRYVYVSGEMYKRPEYKGVNDNFKYLIVCTKAQKRDYKCKTWYEIEYKKIYASGKSDKDLLESLKGYTGLI